jgi:hypothetical protein
MIDYNTSDTYKLLDSYSDSMVEDLKDSSLFSEVTSQIRSYEAYSTNDVFVKLSEKGISYMNQYPEGQKPRIELFISYTKNK